LVVEFGITIEARRQAIYHADKRKAAEEKHQLKSYFYELNNYVTYRKSYLGEWAFGEYLKSMNIISEEDKVYDRPDKYDFKIGTKTVDVKTGMIKTDIQSCIDNPNFKALVVDYQVQNKPQDIYVFAYLNREETKIWLVGWATLEEVKNWEIKEVRTTNRVCPLSELRPMGDLKL